MELGGVLRPVPCRLLTLISLNLAETLSNATREFCLQLQPSANLAPQRVDCGFRKNKQTRLLSREVLSARRRSHSSHQVSHDFYGCREN
jgi:hypothetical protein